MKTLAIVVTYNRKNLLSKCITSLLNQKNAVCDILVVDNNSMDGTEDLIKSQFSNVYYINTKKNLGGAGGFNFGIKNGFELGKEYKNLWIMDDDTIPDDNCLEEFEKVADEYDDYGFLSARTVWIDNELCLMNRQFKKDGKGIDEKTKNMELLKQCSFVSCFINTKAVISEGLPIKEFFIWGDDTEYTNRISKKFTSYYINTCKVTHEMNNNNTVDIESDVYERIDRYFYLYRNRFYIAKKNKKTIKYIGSVIKTILKILLKSKNYKIKRIKIVMKGFYSGIKFNPSIEYIK